jgi:hypothetical protein
MAFHIVTSKSCENTTSFKWMFRPYQIFMRPTANPVLYQMEKE